MRTPHPAEDPVPGGRPLRVAVGMSGGIDSSVAAWRLRREGHEVIGLTMQLWDGSLPLPDLGRSGCYGPGEPRELEAARRCAERLGIPHHTVPLADVYRERVLEHVRSEYLAGRTPNPCIACNRRVKFDALPAAAREAGLAFDRFATGHYARTAFDPARGRYVLRKGADPAKDQSYFLSHLSQEQLALLLLPLGGLTKRAVREQARALGWTDLLERPESQDFLEADDYGVLFRGGEVRPGPVVDPAGRRLGTHRGIVHYTVGQRKGLGLGGAGRALYVLRIDAAANTLVVGGHAELFSRAFRALRVNWVALDGPPPAPLRVRARIRQQHREAEATLTAGPGGDTAEGVFDEPQEAVTPGQAAVFYDGDTVLAAGTIGAAGRVPAGAADAPAARERAG